MPRYFFDITGGSPDTEGTELPYIYTAQAEAVRFTGEVLRDKGARFWNDTAWMLTVSDEHRRALFVLRFSVEERDLVGA